MKKMTLLMLCACMMFFAACSKDKGTPSPAGKNNAEITFDGYKGSEDAVLTINGEDVSVDEFNYFLIMAAYDMKNAKGINDADIDAFFAETDIISKKTNAALAVEDAIKRCTVFHVYRTEALKQGITLSEEDKKQIDTFANGMVNQYDEEMNELQLKAGGLTPEVHYDITEMSYYSNLLFSKFVGEFREITQSDIEEYYRDNYVRAKHILVMTINPETNEPLPEAEQQNALERISEVYGKIQAGENFDVLMAEYSDDTGLQLKPDGYTFAKDDEYTEAFKQTAFSLEAGAVSEIVQSEFGYHIVKREPLLDDFPVSNFEPIQEKIYSAEFQAMLDKCNADAEIIGNNPVFSEVNVAKVLGDYLDHQAETMELIKKKFIEFEAASAQ